MLASTPSAAGPSTAPGESRVLPARMSSPAPRMLLPSSRAGTVTTPSRSSVTSTWTTAPVPSGTTAPVEMRTAVPGSTVPSYGMAGARLARDRPARRRRRRGSRTRPWPSWRRAGRRRGWSPSRPGCARGPRSSGTSSPASGRTPVQDDLPGGLDWRRLGHGPILDVMPCGILPRPDSRSVAPMPSVAHRSRPYGAAVPEPDRLTITPLRGPLARLDRAREDLAKAWLMRMIERASLEEITHAAHRADRLRAAGRDLRRAADRRHRGPRPPRAVPTTSASAPPAWPTCARATSPARPS